ncbi:uncharacterized protein LOC141730468 [Zonotrichia albicollis]|uniref:uncharacterized protein LOC141730468 n=1 Tax=Zonotrichia albicollis TaxID=44394 RepID=UPI003D80EAB7
MPAATTRGRTAWGAVAQPPAQRTPLPQAGPGSPRRERCRRLRFPGRARAPQRAPSPAGSAAGGKRPRERRHGRAETARAPLLREPSLPASLPAWPPPPPPALPRRGPAGPGPARHSRAAAAAPPASRRERPHTNLRARAPLRRSRDRESAPRSPAAPAARPPLTRAPLPGRGGGGRARVREGRARGDCAHPVTLSVAASARWEQN